MEDQEIAVGTLTRPHDRQSLRQWIQTNLKLDIPERPICSGHATPLDYLDHTFFERGGDAVVWACRGGGKTMIGAVATLLDLLFKPGIQVRILGGSFEQSDRMYRYLLSLMEDRFAELLQGRPTRRGLALVNGSRVEILAQSHRSVRGQRVQKLRCDEVELFDEAVWEAGQLTTRSVKLPFGAASNSAAAGPTAPTDLQIVRGTIEAFSTMHRAAGLMEKILRESIPQGVASGENPLIGRRIFAWCLWDVIERCPPERPCVGCGLAEDCRGRAKEASGFLQIEDCLVMKGRVSRKTWANEMLCHPPRAERPVFAPFSRERHVRAAAAVPTGAAAPGVEPVTPGSIIHLDGRELWMEKLIAGVDFGYRGAFVCLWIAILREGRTGGHTVWVFDEMVRTERTVRRNGLEMQARPWQPAVVYTDVAGEHINSQTAQTDQRVLRELGFVVKASWMMIDPGVQLINDLLDPAEGPPRFFVHPRCGRLIEALAGYECGKDGEPIKDGRHDHLIDALRYALVNQIGGTGKVNVRHY